MQTPRFLDTSQIVFEKTDFYGEFELFNINFNIRQELFLFFCYKILPFEHFSHYSKIHVSHPFLEKPICSVQKDLLNYKKPVSMIFLY